MFADTEENTCRVLLKDNTNKVVDQRKGFNDKKGCELKNILKQILL